MKHRGPMIGSIVAACFVPGCLSTVNTDASAAADITRMLDRQSAAWNEGDLESFMQPYWHSPQLTFSSKGQTLRGWESLRQRYQTHYPTKQAMGRLRFGELEVKPLAPDVALVLGRWDVAAEKASGGRFTLVVRKTSDGWRIMHDHTSAD